MVSTRRTGSLFALLGFMALATEAHVTFTTDETLPGVQLNTSLAVGHGCDGSPTISLAVSVPENITSVEPQEIPGWNLTLTHRDGTSGPISNFTWAGGPLDPTSYLAFGVLIDVPNFDVSQNNVTLFFPAVQTCQNGTREWVFQGSQADADAAKQEPAPELIITNTPKNKSAETGHGDHSSGHGDHSSEQDESGAQQLLGLSAAVAASAFGVFYQFLL